jgi:hypothetical protein
MCVGIQRSIERKGIRTRFGKIECKRKMEIKFDVRREVKKEEFTHTKEIQGCRI